MIFLHVRDSTPLFCLWFPIPFAIFPASVGKTVVGQEFQVNPRASDKLTDKSSQQANEQNVPAKKIWPGEGDNFGQAKTNVYCRAEVSVMQILSF